MQQVAEVAEEYYPEASSDELSDILGSYSDFPPRLQLRNPRLQLWNPNQWRMAMALAVPFILGGLYLTLQRVPYPKAEDKRNEDHDDKVPEQPPSSENAAAASGTEVPEPSHSIQDATAGAEKISVNESLKKSAKLILENPDPQSLVSEAVSKQGAETKEGFKRIKRICKKQKISVNESLKKSAKLILENPDPQKYVTEQLDIEKCMIEKDLEEINKNLLKIQVKIVKIGYKKELINEREKTEENRNRLVKERNALEQEKTLVDLLTKINSKPAIDPKWSQ